VGTELSSFAPGTIKNLKMAEFCKNNPLEKLC
jgi:hypothetical protein